MAFEGKEKKIAIAAILIAGAICWALVGITTGAAGPWCAAVILIIGAVAEVAGDPERDVYGNLNGEGWL